jgi:hypothetical protein
MDIVEFIGYICFFFLMWQLLKSWIFVQGLKHRIAEAVEEEIAVKEAEKQVLALRFEHVEENGHQVVLAYGKNNRFRVKTCLPLNHVSQKHSNKEGERTFFTKKTPLGFLWRNLFGCFKY